MFRKRNATIEEAQEQFRLYVGEEIHQVLVDVESINSRLERYEISIDEAVEKVKPVKEKVEWLIFTDQVKNAAAADNLHTSLFLLDAEIAKQMRGGIGNTWEEIFESPFLGNLVDRLIQIEMDFEDQE